MEAFFDPTEQLVQIVSQFFSVKGLKRDISGNFIDILSNRRIRHKDVLIDFELWSGTLRQANRGITEKLLLRAFEKAVRQLDEGNRQQFCEQLRFSPDAPMDVIAKWVRAVTGRSEADPGDIAVIEHFIYQVKRKMFDLPVDWHLMPILTGPQGTGKSKAVKDYLLQPVLPFTLKGKGVDFLEDEREHLALSVNYVCFFDEMAKAQNVDVNILKNKISGDFLDPRLFHTQILEKVSQNCTFIGASNELLQELIFDPTGMRRFYEIKCFKSQTEAEQRERWAALKRFDVLDMWLSVDETAEVSPYEREKAIIQPKQELIRSKTNLEEWLQEKGYAYAFDGTEVLASTLYGEFIRYCEISGIKEKHKIKMTQFTRSLREIHGFESKRTASGIVFLIGNYKTKVSTHPDVLDLNKKRLV